MEQNAKDHITGFLDDIINEYSLVEPFEKRVKKVVSGKNLPINILYVPLYKDSFHSKENVTK